MYNSSLPNELGRDSGFVRVPGGRAEAEAEAEGSSEEDGCGPPLPDGHQAARPDRSAKPKQIQGVKPERVQLQLELHRLQPRIFCY